MATIDQYLSLITSAWRQKTKFIATVSLDVSVQVRVQNLLLSMMTTLFDLELAVGDQLDIIGQWVGISREITTPIAGVFFSWDDTAADGWDYGTWQPSYLPTDVTILPDDAYLTLIKAKIAANHWDGTIPGAYDIWDQLFPNLIILIQDRQDMSYDLAFFGGPIDSLTVAIITGGYIPLKPEGVLVNVYYIPVDTNPLFGWDIESDYIQGWDEGSWAQEYFPT